MYLFSYVCELSTQNIELSLKTVFAHKKKLLKKKRYLKKTKNIKLLKNTIKQIIIKLLRNTLLKKEL